MTSTELAAFERVISPRRRFFRGCLLAEAVLVSLAGAWEIGQRIRDLRIVKKARPDHKRT